MESNFIMNFIPYLVIAKYTLVNVFVNGMFFDDSEPAPLPYMRLSLH